MKPVNYKIYNKVYNLIQKDYRHPYNSGVIFEIHLGFKLRMELVIETTNRIPHPRIKSEYENNDSSEIKFLKIIGAM